MSSIKAGIYRIDNEQSLEIHEHLINNDYFEIWLCKGLIKVKLCEIPKKEFSLKKIVNQITEGEEVKEKARIEYIRMYNRYDYQKYYFVETTVIGNNSGFQTIIYLGNTLKGIKKEIFRLTNTKYDSIKYQNAICEFITKNTDPFAESFTNFYHSYSRMASL